MRRTIRHPRGLTRGGLISCSNVLKTCKLTRVKACKITCHASTASKLYRKRQRAQQDLLRVAVPPKCLIRAQERRIGVGRTLDAFSSCCDLQFRPQAKWSLSRSSKGVGSNEEQRYGSTGEFYKVFLKKISLLWQQYCPLDRSQGPKAESWGYPT